MWQRILICRRGRRSILTTNEETHYAEEYLKVKKERLQSVEDID